MKLKRSMKVSIVKKHIECYLRCRNILLCQKCVQEHLQKPESTYEDNICIYFLTKVGLTLYFGINDVVKFIIPKGCRSYFVHQIIANRILPRVLRKQIVFLYRFCLFPFNSKEKVFSILIEY